MVTQSAETMDYQSQKAWIDSHFGGSIEGWLLGTGVVFTDEALNSEPSQRGMLCHWIYHGEKPRGEAVKDSKYGTQADEGTPVCSERIVLGYFLLAENKKSMRIIASELSNGDSRREASDRDIGWATSGELPLDDFSDG